MHLFGVIRSTNLLSCASWDVHREETPVFLLRWMILAHSASHQPHITSICMSSVCRIMRRHVPHMPTTVVVSQHQSMCHGVVRSIPVVGNDSSTCRAHVTTNTSHHNCRTQQQQLHCVSLSRHLYYHFFRSASHVV